MYSFPSEGLEGPKHVAGASQSNNYLYFFAQTG